jgi:hypothetical protein
VPIQVGCDGWKNIMEQSRVSFYLSIGMAASIFVGKVNSLIKKYALGV